MSETATKSTPETIHWIGVDDAMPTERLAVIVKLEHWKCSEAFYREGKWYWSAFNPVLNARVTHWAEFPTGPGGAK